MLTFVVDAAPADSGTAQLQLEARIQYDRLPALTAKFTKPDGTAYDLQDAKNDVAQVWLAIGKHGDPFIVDQAMAVPPAPTTTPAPAVDSATYAWGPKDLMDTGEYEGEVTLLCGRPTAATAGFLLGGVVVDGVVTVTVTPAPTPVPEGADPATWPAPTPEAPVTVAVDLAANPLTTVADVIAALKAGLAASAAVAVATDPMQPGWLFFTAKAPGVLGNGAKVEVAIHHPDPADATAPELPGLWAATAGTTALTLLTAGGVTPELLPWCVGQFKLKVNPAVRDS